MARRRRRREEMDVVMVPMLPDLINGIVPMLYSVARGEPAEAMTREGLALLADTMKAALLEHLRGGK